VTFVQQENLFKTIKTEILTSKTQNDL
jgi:hypothetical protein